MVDDWAPGTIKIPLPRLIIALYGSNFATIFAHFISHLKIWSLSRGYFGSWGHPLLAVAVVKRFKQESMYGLSGGTKKSGRCGEVAFSGGSTALLFKQ